jgi:undecaprenyl-phosphate galactose phosphotransferase
MEGESLLNRIINPKGANRLGIFFLLLSDIFVLIVLFYLSSLVREYLFPIIFSDLPVYFMNFKLYSWVFLIWIFILGYEGAYSKRFAFWDEIKVLWKCTFFASLAVFTVLFIGKQGIMFSRTLILTMSLLSFMLFPVFRIAVKRVLFSSGLLKRKVIILGSGDAAKNALKSINNEPNLGYEIAGFVDDSDIKEVEGIRVHRFIDKLERYIRKCGIQDIIIAKPELDKEKLTEIINHIQHKADNILYMPDLYGIAVLGTELRHFFNEQSIVIEIKNNLAVPINYFIKRFVDFFVGILLLVVFALPLIIISIIIKLSSRGPVIFEHERVGKEGRTFMCYKFRTMYKDAEHRLKDILANNPESLDEWEKGWKLKDDPRITDIGKFLRKTSFDELPQIFNVLKGEMSLVGPRPVTKDEIDLYYRDASELCFSVPPGITGLWQVSGRSETTYEQRISLDSWYVRNWNLWLDLIILFKTIKVVLIMKGAE